MENGNFSHSTESRAHEFCIFQRRVEIIAGTSACAYRVAMGKLLKIRVDVFAIFSRRRPERGGDNEHENEVDSPVRLSIMRS